MIPSQSLSDWSAKCLQQAQTETDPDAQAAFVQLADEFLAIETELEGLTATFEAVSYRKRIFASNMA